MNKVVLDNIPCEIDFKELQEKLRINEESDCLVEIKMMAAEAQLLARPKVVYKNAKIEAKGDNFVVIDGIKFTSRVLRVNLEEALEVFPYVVTCGTELEDWSKQFEDVFTIFCADTIKEMVLRLAFQTFEAHLDKEFGLGHAVEMNPGSLSDWPINEQIHLFELLGNVKELIGVQLTDSYLMLPIKSISGIRFPKEGTFENCQLCPREKCPSRKALFDKEYAESYKIH
ncbi:vitamin B12 dependent-methionine synthase activation domain-containing protein [Desulfosporosinus sp. Sb-LF]|uniref:vitamin B12 dependent-methionine synthase activation domain-containing protein n=1 Tax=Desulfosporosinus sp. Sb-LF TaxID=2560027 RepID=UPI00107F7497|nr:vitamin B12 dependent-methionine synthase activation domain-containing protein [Desulfosporosinus sp. Sb-LF]TGE32502.1 vitamin B12 dependent methionine synthase [Desulfosporosinus sp. Sb-LF]